MLSQFAESGPVIHITPLPLFEINGWVITNSILYAWITGLVLLTVLVTVGTRMTIAPKKGFTQIVEIGAEFIIGMLEGSFGSRKKAIKYAPYFMAIFFFISMTNLLGLLPGVGEAFTWHGEPLLRPSTADLNGTLAVAIVSLLMVQYFAMRESGFSKHLRHYFSGNLRNPMTYVAGIYEIFGEFIRLVSLSLRLFLNIAIGEVIIAVFSYLGKFAAPITSLPFVMLEMGVAFLQAYIFVMLTTTYLSLAIHHGDDDHADVGLEVNHIAELEAK